MVRPVQIGPVTLYHGCALEVLADLRGQADCVVTDPPYALTSGGRGRVGDGSMSGKFCADRYANDGRFFPPVDWAEMARPIYDALGKRGHAYIMCTDRHLGAADAAFKRAGFRFHRMLVWPTLPKPNRWYMPDAEFALFLFKGAAFRIARPGSRQTQAFAPVIGGDHPTEKPVAMMAHWITNSTLAGDVVLDPFMGSGATLVAAIETGRRAIGIERDARWFNHARRRCEVAWAEKEKAA